MWRTLSVPLKSMSRLAGLRSRCMMGGLKVCK